MEDFEMTTMTTGTSVAVAQRSQERAMDVPSSDTVVTSQEVFSDPNLGLETPRDEAEMLFKSAKEEGFEEALTHLAEGDFERDVQEELIDENVDEEMPEEFEFSGEDTSQEVLEEQRDVLLEKIDVLDVKVSHLIEQNAILQEKLKKSDERVQMTHEMFIEMFKYLYEMAKKEEDEKKKLGLFEMLIDIIAKFLVTVVEPDTKPQEEKKSKDETSLSKHTPSFEEMIKFLQEKNTKGFGNSPQAA